MAYPSGLFVQQTPLGSYNSLGVQDGSHEHQLDLSFRRANPKPLKNVKKALGPIFVERIKPKSGQNSLNLTRRTFNMTEPLKKIFVLLTFLLCSFLSIGEGWAQGNKESVQFTGVIIGGKDSSPIPGVYVMISKANRGVVTNEYGYFSLSVLPGDSIMFSSIGYKKKYHVIPEKTEKTYSVIVDLQEDVTQLSPVTIYPYPTEEIFKESFLAMQLPDEKDQQNMRRNLNKEQMNWMLSKSGMSANENFRNYTNSSLNYNANRNFNPTWNFLNPFAWAQFIKSVKNGDLKKKENK